MTAEVPTQRAEVIDLHADRQMRALIVGAGAAGRTLARDILGVTSFGLLPVGFVDDEASLSGLELPLLGPLRDLTDIVIDHQIEVVVLAIPSLPPERFRVLALDAARGGALVRYLPSFLAALRRDMAGSDLRALDVRALIGRDEMHLVSPEAQAVVKGRRVLVTGAGGSIGSELCRQVSRFGPSKLYMLDHDESNLHRLQLELSGEALLDDDGLVVADIRDRGRIHQLFGELRPDVVFHAAAHKHLPLLEKHPCEGVKTNVIGTQNLVQAALWFGVGRFIFISTDKAADPTSVLGATKRLGELVVREHSHGAGSFASVRFGNVLGSRGSLLTVISEQLRSGLAVTVTHPDVTRFFMTIEEAVGLVLEAARMADRGEVFVLDMGSPVRIVDLVRTFAAQVHLTDVDIRYTGLRPGEKLNEALFSEHEVREPTEHDQIFKTCPGEAACTRPHLFEELEQAAAANDPARVKSALRQMLPGYEPASAMQPVLAGGAAPAPYPDYF
jgi:FlaA1/EpsC-like NDP-sugar epimerase